MESANNNNNSSSIMAEELRKIHQKLESLSAENGQLRAEIETVKEKHITLEEKMVALQANNAELMNANNREVLAKLKVVKLEAKLANEQLGKAIEAKMTELMSKAKKRIDELELALVSKIEEAHFNLQNEFNEVAQGNQQQFTKQIADMEKKVMGELDRMAVHFEDKMVDLENQQVVNAQMTGGIVARLANSEADGNPWH